MEALELSLDPVPLLRDAVTGTVAMGSQQMAAIDAVASRQYADMEMAFV